MTPSTPSRCEFRGSQACFSFETWPTHSKLPTRQPFQTSTKPSSSYSSSPMSSQIEGLAPLALLAAAVLEKLEEAQRWSRSRRPCIPKKFVEWCHLQVRDSPNWTRRSSERPGYACWCGYQHHKQSPWGRFGSNLLSTKCPGSQLPPCLSWFGAWIQSNLHLPDTASHASWFASSVRGGSQKWEQTAQQLPLGWRAWAASLAGTVKSRREPGRSNQNSQCPSRRSLTHWTRNARPVHCSKPKQLANHAQIEMKRAKFFELSKDSRWFKKIKDVNRKNSFKNIENERAELCELCKERANRPLLTRFPDSGEACKERAFRGLFQKSVFF